MCYISLNSLQLFLSYEPDKKWGWMDKRSDYFMPLFRGHKITAHTKQCLTDCLRIDDLPVQSLFQHKPARSLYVWNTPHGTSSSLCPALV